VPRRAGNTGHTSTGCDIAVAVISPAPSKWRKH
jgi:hypothetical protein